MDRRIDKRTTLLIDAAINAEASHGYAPAASKLTTQGIALYVTIRVLTRPEERRHYSSGAIQDILSKDA
jgi:hypothetical protein